VGANPSVAKRVRWQFPRVFATPGDRDPVVARLPKSSLELGDLLPRDGRVEPKSPDNKKRPRASAEIEPSFEVSLARLGEIVEQLESGELPLERSLELFEEGVRLSRASQAKLDQAERRVEELLSIDEAGNPVVRELPTE